ncbi:hypothetical protein HYFRA_00010201 [Hymenoscyphus fraxineus]|uniref:Uncharacterized protein n=1 Tax=Hymenoscyphus fraxineus TaxID=746836 RepID=A0A9N9PTF6_9HELO|nr:hypothetical protein HYFRA_00010201 [Hymenoscyphus fraxineus]
MLYYNYAMPTEYVGVSAKPRFGNVCWSSLCLIIDLDPWKCYEGRCAKKGEGEARLAVMSEDIKISDGGLIACICTRTSESSRESQSKNQIFRALRSMVQLQKVNNDSLNAVIDNGMILEYNIRLECLDNTSKITQVGSSRLVVPAQRISKVHRVVFASQETFTSTIRS